MPPSETSTQAGPGSTESLPDAVEAGAFAESPPPRAAHPHATRNLVSLIAYDVIVRVGWIFKTESVIMPAFLDMVAGPGWIRGCLLVVNRFGQSIPPALFARRLSRLRLKKRSLATWTVAMGLPFLILAGVWSQVGSAPPSWTAPLFLVLYGEFSCCHGLNQLSYSTLQGKLLPVRLRGRMMALAASSGSFMAIGFAWWLMGDWLQTRAGFVPIFAFTGVCFALAAAWALALAEQPDERAGRAAVVEHPLRGAWNVLRTDGNFRRFAAVVMLSVFGTVLFPHYQAMAREELGLVGGNLMIWVIVQNGAVGVFGLIVGYIVEHYGERRALRLAVFGNVVAPLTALALSGVAPEVGRKWFWLVFIPLGMTPISLKTMVGYTLEIAPEHDHPRYLSTLSLCLAVPFCFSPLVGAMVDWVGYEQVFLGGAVLIGLAGLLTFRLIEPRHAHAEIH